ncbi:hypothetical protein JCM6882_001893 [Rhodosporidiobolus microsporus]
MHQAPYQHAHTTSSTFHTNAQAPYPGAGAVPLASPNSAPAIASTSNGAAGMVNGAGRSQGGYGAYGGVAVPSGAVHGAVAPHLARAGSAASTPAHSPAMGQGAFYVNALAGSASASAGANPERRDGASPPKKKKRRDGDRPVYDWGKEELFKRRAEVMGRAKALAMQGTLRIELILEKSSTMPALRKAGLPTHGQQVKEFPTPKPLLPGTTLQDYLSTFHAWSAWTASVEVSTFPINGALVACFLADRVPVIAQRPKTVFILEQYRKATVDAFVNLGLLSMDEITAKERKLKDTPPMLHLFDWAQWRLVVKEAGRALARWKAITELAPASHPSLHSQPSHSRSASQSSTPGPVSSSSANAPLVSHSSASQAARPTLPHAPNGSQTFPQSSAAPSPHLTTASDYQQRHPSVVNPPHPTPTVSTSSHAFALQPPVIPLAPAHQYPPVLPAPPPAGQSVTVKVKAAPPLGPSSQATLVQAAAPLSAKARGKQRESAGGQEGSFAVAAARPIQPAPQAAGAPQLVPLAPAMQAPAPAPAPAPAAPKRKRRTSQKALAAVELPSEDQAEEAAFFAAAAELQDALAEFTVAKAVAAARLGQAVEQPRGAADQAHPFSDYLPLPLPRAEMSGNIARCRDSRDGLNVLRPPPAVAKPQHLEITSQPLPPALPFDASFNLVAPLFIAYPQALRPVAPADIPTISNYAYSLGQSAVSQLHEEPGAAECFPPGSDIHELEVRRRLAETARRTILRVPMEELPPAREPLAARQARERTLRLLEVHAQEQKRKREAEENERRATVEKEKGKVRIAEGDKGEPDKPASRPPSPSTPAEPTFPFASAPPAPSATKTPSASGTTTPAVISPATASPASASRPLHRPSLGAIGSVASAPAVPGTRPRSGSTGMRRRPSIGNGDVHPLLKIYASASGQVRSLARAKAAEIKGVPSDEVAAGLANATARLSQSPMLGMKHPRLHTNPNSPQVGWGSALPAPDASASNGAAKGAASASLAQNSPAASSRPRMASPPLVPIPLAPVEEVADGAPGGEEGPDADVDMAEPEEEERAAEPPVPTGETALGMIVELSDTIVAVPAQAASSSPVPTPATLTPVDPVAPTVGPSADSPDQPAASRTTSPAAAEVEAAPSTPNGKTTAPAASASPTSALSSFGSFAKATVGAVTSAAKALPGFAGFGSNGSLSPSSRSGSPASPSGSPAPVASTSKATATPPPSSSSSKATPPAGTPAPGSRGPRKCGVCGSQQCPGRGGRQWCKQGKGAGEVGASASPAGRSVSETTGKGGAPAKDKGKGKERARDSDDDDSDDDDEEIVAASLVPRKRPASDDLTPPPAAAKKKEVDRTVYPNPLRDVPKEWLAVSDPIMPFTMHNRSRRKSRSRSRSKS